MPHRMWDHSHCCGDFLSGSPACNDGEERGRYVGWHLTMHEMMARYQYVYELKPIGPHRKLADEMLTPLRIECPRCEHSGVLNSDDGVRFSICPTCEGTGGTWSAPNDVVAALRDQVLSAFPDAAAPRVRFFSAPLALRTPQNVMVEVGSYPSRSGTRPKPRRKYRPKLRSRDGLLYADVERAFAEAERLVGKGLKLKGRGHCRRVSLVPHYARYAIRGASGSVVRVQVPGSWHPRRLMARPVIEKAAELIGVPASLFIRREY